MNTSVSGAPSPNRQGLHSAGIVFGVLVVVGAIPFAGVVLIAAAVSEQSAIVMYGGSIVALVATVGLGLTMIIGGRKALADEDPVAALRGARAQAIAVSVVVGAVLLWVLLAGAQALWMMGAADPPLP